LPLSFLIFHFRFHFAFISIPLPLIRHYAAPLIDIFSDYSPPHSPLFFFFFLIFSDDMRHEILRHCFFIIFAVIFRAMPRAARHCLSFDATLVFMAPLLPLFSASPA